MKTSAEILGIVNDYIEHLPYDRKPYSLYEPVRYVLSLGGKRIRPVLMMLSYELFADDSTSIIDAAVALETYHNYTLLHDDLMDNAPMRRGKATVHTRWNANTAILSGDTMLVMAYERMAKCKPEMLKPVIDLFTETALQIGEGQQYDMEFETRDDVVEAEYIEMIRLKTSVLLACATKMGALLAGATQQQAGQLYRFGELLGLAFQLQDDYLDVYGDPKVFGKAIGGDILCNKKTYMLINAINTADEAQRKELAHWLSLTENSIDEATRKDKVAAVTRLYNEMAIDKMAENKINQYFDECRKVLDQLDVDPQRKAELIAYTNQMMKRNR